ncbi:hypothetical protein [Spongiactinospora sp. TRM90649]|uniref:hypothetical protein n=1 Tax=Spongiactinospora sp. TRM90649 TaxID=3031114 RepID=UPI0023F97A4E|nr:hypothetical protein [Spongiactinospora sp. TRM90649]MDF5755737.1 hypothetical protein [Spongiactinospora sp. TRM90649]
MSRKTTGPAALHDVQALSDAQTHVYEAVASLAVDGRIAHVSDVAQMTGWPEHDVRQALVTLVENGWLIQKGDGFVMGPHDWGLDYR